MNIKRYLIIVFFVVSGCIRRQEEDVKRIDFIYYVAKPQESIPPEVGTLYMSFHTLKFHNPDDSSSFDSRSLMFEIPDTATSFSLVKNPEYNFHYGAKDGYMKIGSGIVKGILVSKGIWKITADIKHFHFIKYLVITKNGNSYRERIVYD